MCGENHIARQKKTQREGSPPRVRGKLFACSMRLSWTRITPACAGKTYCGLQPVRLPEDHPRVCGENDGSCYEIDANKGSPPRVRGKPNFRLRLKSGSRITPACAGKTLRKWRISVVDPSPQPRSPLTSRRADASSGSQRAPCAAPV